MSSEEEQLPKKERIINAWIAGGEDTSPADVAEVTDASEAYASRIGSQMEEGELDDDEIEEVRNDQLVEQYADRLRRLTEAGGDETGGRGRASADEPSDEGQQAAQGRRQQPQRSSGQHQRQARRHPTQQQPQQARQQRARSRQATSQGQSPSKQAPPRQSSRRQGRQAQQTTQQSQHAQRGPQQGPSQSGNRTVDVAQLRELDEMLAFIQDEADFEMQNLPPEDRGAAAGKLFVAREARAALQSIIGKNDQRQQ